jgi:hypothetical protein
MTRPTVVVHCLPVGRAPDVRERLVSLFGADLLAALEKKGHGYGAKTFDNASGFAAGLPGGEPGAAGGVLRLPLAALAPGGEL